MEEGFRIRMVFVWACVKERKGFGWVWLGLWKEKKGFGWGMGPLANKVWIQPRSSLVVHLGLVGTRI